MERGRGHRASDTPLSRPPGVPEGIGFQTIVHRLSFKEQAPPSTPVWAEQKLRDAGIPAAQASVGTRGTSDQDRTFPSGGRWPNDVLTRATSISRTVLKQPRFSPTSHLPVTESGAFPRLQHLGSGQAPISRPLHPQMRLHLPSPVQGNSSSNSPFRPRTFSCPLFPGSLHQGV